MEAQRRLHFYLILAIAVFVHLFLFLFFGVRDQFVDSRRYIEMADYLTLHGTLEHFYQLFYAVPISLLALCRVVFSDGLTAFVLLQSILSIVAAFALHRATAILFRNANAGFAAAVIFLLWFDGVQWNTAVMTESLASSLTCFTVYLLTIFRNERKQFVLLALMLLIILMTRPTGVLVIVGTVVFLLTRFHDMPVKHRGVGLVGIYIVLGIAFALGAWTMLNEWDFTDQYEKGNIVTYMDVLEGKPLYDESLRMDTTNIMLADDSKQPAEKILMFIIDNPLHFAQAAALKVFYTVTFYRPYFSTAHNVYTFVWLSMVYFLFFQGWRHIQNKPVRNFVVTVIAANCTLVALSAADWDNRFYMPMLPVIALIAGGGGGWVWRKILLRYSTRLS